MSRLVAAPGPREKAAREAEIARLREARAAIRSMSRQPGWQVMKAEALQELFRTIEAASDTDSIAQAGTIGACKKLVAILRIYGLDERPTLDTVTTKAGQSAPGGQGHGARHG